MKDISIRNAEQLGQALRLKRKEKELSQSALAELLGEKRKWVLPHGGIRAGPKGA